jgi:hypothetical protein
VTIKPGLLSDPCAEDTLLGLLLTGRKEVYQFTDALPRDFEDIYYRLISHALLPIHDLDDDAPIETVTDCLDAAGLIEPAMFAVPLVWYVRLMEKAVGRTHRVMDEQGIELADCVTALSLRVKLAAANRADAWREKYGSNDVNSVPAAS